MIHITTKKQYKVHYSGKKAGELYDRCVTVTLNGKVVCTLGAIGSDSDEYLYKGSCTFSSLEEAIDFASYRYGDD